MKRRTKKKIVIALVAALGVLMIAYAGLNFYQIYGYKKYVDKKAGFSVRFPNDWAYSMYKDGANVIFYTPNESDADTFTENVNIVVQDISAEPLNLEEYTELAIRQMEIVFEGKIEVVESLDVRLGSRKAHKFVFLTDGKPITKMMIIWTVKGDLAYQFTYFAQEDTFDFYYKRVERMAASFRITRS